MKNKVTTAIVALLLLSGTFSAVWARPTDPGKDGSQQVDAAVYFRIGESAVDPSFEGNRIRLLVFLNDLRRIQADSNYVISRIEVAGTASPDGSQDRNEQLAGERAAALASWLVSEAGIPSEKISVVNGGENWTGLRQMMEASDQMPFRDEMLALMDIEDRDVRKHKMMYYADSKPWLWMYDRFFPALRKGAGGTQTRASQNRLSTEKVPMTGSCVSFSYELNPKTQAHAAEIPEPDTVTEPAVVDVTQQPIQSRRPFSPVVALKTDLMLWGGVMPDIKTGTWTPNLSAELYFARRWSAEAGYAYAAWDAYDGGLYSVSAGNVGLRSWLGKASSFRGFYLGLFGVYGQYDVQEAALGQTGSFWYAGLGAGWLQVFSRHWAFEAEIRGGYRSAQNEFYDIEPNHYYFNRKETNGKFIPQFRLQVIYRFGRSGK